MLPLLYELVLICTVNSVLFSGANADISPEEFNAALSSEGTYAVYYHGMQSITND